MHVSTFGLEINRPENCAAQLDSGVQASVHYHVFDSEKNGKIAILSMQNAGIRVVDVRDPAHPREIAYFNPGDVDPDSDVLLDNACGNRYLFWVGDGALHSGAPSNPIELLPSAP